MNTDAIRNTIDERLEYILLTTLTTLTVTFVFAGQARIIQENPITFVLFFCICWVLVHTLRYIFIILEKKFWYERT
jgi:hypothetical protein